MYEACIKMSSSKESFTRSYLLGFGTLLVGALAGAYFFPREFSNIDIEDRDNDGYLDIIIDKNWEIILTNKSEYLIPVENIQPNYKICYFTEPISMENIGTDFAQRSRSILEDCLKN